jgi:hypothetical protein
MVQSEAQDAPSQSFLTPFPPNFYLNFSLRIKILRPVNGTVQDTSEVGTWKTEAFKGEPQ